MNNGAQIHGSPGEGARMQGLARAIWPLLAVLFVCGYVLGAVVRWPPFNATTGGVTLLAIAVILFLGAHFCSKRIAAFFKGALGEERVANVLARLPAGYHVFHSVSLGTTSGSASGDMDHVVVGPTGVFVIETKNWRGRVTLVGENLLLDGVPTRRDPLVQARQACATLSARLANNGAAGVPLTAVVCFASESLTPDCVQAGDVIVCNASRLLDALADAEKHSQMRINVDRVVAVLAPAETK